MAGWIASIGYNFGSLARFAGRDTRGRFWPYAVFLFILSTMAAFVIIAMVMVGLFMRIQQFAVEHPDGFPIDDKDPYARPSLPPELMPDFAAVMMPMMAVNVFAALLIAAAVVRRLHDRDLSGLWGAIPLPFWAIGALVGPGVLSGVTAAPAGPPEPALFMLLMLNNLLSFATFVGLIVLLAGEGTRGPNRYGPEPAAAS